MNFQSLITTALMDDEPLTQELQDDDDSGEFVPQKRRNRRASQISVSSDSPACFARRQSVAKRSRRNWSSIYVNNIPQTTTEKDIEEIFAVFGKVTDVWICKRTPENIEDNILNFAFVSFETGHAAELALAKDEEGIFLRDESKSRIRVHPRRNSLTSTKLRVKSPKKQVASSGPQGHPKGSDWQEILSAFDWHQTAFQYIHRKVTMEDYLREFIHTLASFRDIESEPIEALKEKLVFLAENRPSVLDEMMPPSISGLVYNQSQEDNFNLRAILRDDVRFRIEKSQVIYRETMPRDAAARKLKWILLEGLFVYFLAKFSHGPTFPIKNSYYVRSEPIRSALQTVMGVTDIVFALRGFFRSFQQIFVFNEKKSELKLTVDYFTRENRDKLRQSVTTEINPDQTTDPVDCWEELAVSSSDEEPFVMDQDSKEEFCDLTGAVTDPDRGLIQFNLGLHRECAYYNKENFYVNGKKLGDGLPPKGIQVHFDIVKQPRGAISFMANPVWIGEKPDISDDSTSKDAATDLLKGFNSFLDPADEVIQHVETPPEFDDLPPSVQSVVHHVLEEDFFGDFISNPIVVDELLDQFAGQLQLHERNKLKIIFESEARRLLAKIMSDAIL